MANVLLTVSGAIDPGIETQIEQGMRPQADYVAMADTFGADLMDYTRARKVTGWLGRLLEWLGGSNLMLAWACFCQRTQYAVLFTDGEQVGILLALLLKLSGCSQTQHLMIVHILSVGKKMIFFDWLRVQSHIHIFFVYATWQKSFIEERWQIPAERVIFTPFMVDSHFFAPARVTAQPRRMICAVGLEFRDYPTLIEAVRGLDVEVVIAAASPWSKRSDTTQQVALPDNVTVRRFTQYELRQLYADSLFVVMPLYNVNFQAGVTAVLEAMAMGKAVICSRTPGQSDVVVEGRTGVYVPVGDSVALREAIEHLLQNPGEAARMGESGRQHIERRMSLKWYTRRLNEYVLRAVQHSTHLPQTMPVKPIHWDEGATHD